MAVLRVLVVFLTTCCICWSQSKRAFSTLDDVRGNGSLLVHAVTDLDTHEYQHVVFPTMKFSCSGEVKKVKLLTKPIPDFINENQRLFGIGRFVNKKNYTVVYRNSTLTRIEGSGTGFEIRYKPGEMTFHDGDSLAVDLSHVNLFYDTKKTVQKCVSPVYRMGTIWNCSMMDGLQPLITIETDTPWCVDGFVKEEIFDYIMNATQLISNEDAHFPLRFFNMKIQCQSYFYKWTVGAKFSNDHSTITTIDMIDQNTNFNLTQVNTTLHYNVYEYEVHPRIFTPRDIYHIKVNSSQIYLERCAFSNCSSRPLVAVELGDCYGNCKDCTKGFIGLEKLREKARYIPNFASVNESLITFTDLQIVENGLLVKWIFTGVMLTPPPYGRRHPRLIIVPSNFSREEGINCSDDRLKCLDSSMAIETEYPYVFECTVDPPLPVNIGDYIAIDQPHEDLAVFKIKFVRIPPVERTLIQNRNSLLLHPLIYLNITGIMTEPTTEMMTEMMTEMPDQPSNIGAIAGGVAVGVAALLTIVIVSIVVVWIVRRSRSIKIQNEGTSNPMYTPNLSPREPSDSDIHTIKSQIYAEPTEPTEPTTNGKNQTSTSEVHYSEPSAAVAEYAHLTETPTATNTFTNAEYFLSHKQPSIPPVQQNHYEIDSGIYVPTKEQRQHIQSDSNVYATLEEVQVGGKEECLVFFEECEIYWDPADSRDDIYAQLANRKYREIPAHLIRETGHLGSGEFGTVNKGLWLDKEKCVEVAVKRLKDDFSEEEAVMFLQEAAIMGQFKHPNIIQLYGVVTVVKPVMIVTELAHYGNLREYLLSRFSIDPGQLPPSDTSAMLSQFCVQVARGMKYLSGKAFVHRDLAARNILVTDTKTCKISDFGMSRDLTDSYYVSRGGQIPVKWTAPEALHYKKYSTASDVWSFGCLMYEIWSLGHKPFEGYTNIEAVGLVDKGCRLSPPPGCPKEMYRLMINCWNADKGARPQFREIVETLSQPEDLLLHIPEEVTEDHPQASILGAPLEAGRNLYTELQNTYMV